MINDVHKFNDPKLLRNPTRNPNQESNENQKVKIKFMT